MGNGMLVSFFGLRLASSFLVDFGLLNFVFAFKDGQLDNNKSSSGLCDDCSIAA